MNVFAHITLAISVNRLLEHVVGDLDELLHIKSKAAFFGLGKVKECAEKLLTTVWNLGLTTGAQMTIHKFKKHLAFIF